MILQFNFPIEKSQLNDLLTLTKKGTVIPHTITAWSGSETRFLVTPKDGGFRYDQSYRLNIAA